MTRARVLPVAVMKEIRALLPTWVACTVAISAGAMVADPKIIGAGILAYGLGSIALGAQSIGHEYSYRTLALLLSQPSDRRRLILLKFGVLISMLATLTVVAWSVLVNDNGEFIRGWTGHEPALLVVAALCSLFVAPWLTMLCRSTLAGMVLSVAVPGSLLVMGDVIGVAKYGFGGGALIDRFKLAFLWWGMFVVCAVAAVSSWRMFIRLEAIDGRGPDVHLPQWLRGRIQTRDESSGLVRRRHPVWLLARKELRLQQMTFVLVGLYILGWGTVSLLEHFIPEFPLIPLGALAVLYFGLLSILIGSLASAEERQLGTLEWQVLLPMATWKQWMVKVGTVLGLAALLGVGLPALLWFIGPSSHYHELPGAWQMTAVVVVLLTTCSLYLSSVCSSGVRAMVLSLPVVVGALVFTQVVASTVRWALYHPFVGSPGVLPRALRPTPPFKALTIYLALVMAAGLIALLLRLALINHRSAERSATRIWQQVIWIVGLVTLGAALLTGVWAFYYGPSVKL